MSNPFRLIHVVGARPQIIKSAALHRAVDRTAGAIDLQTLHTGQHYARDMSGNFYDELGIPIPHDTLSSISGTHAEQTSHMMLGASSYLAEQQPDAVLVYGDTNSTLAAAMAAYMLNIPVMHVEAGLRSANLAMPEEANRIATDHLSTLLFCPTPAAIEHLAGEGIYAHSGHATQLKPKAILTGDVMYDNSIHFANHGLAQAPSLEHDYILVTCHRPVNVDDRETFSSILKVLAEISRTVAPIIWPEHPRLSKHSDLLASYRDSDTLRLIDPVSYTEMARLQSNASLIITDSGGVQKEAFFNKRPCIVLREETEWTELVALGSSVLCGNNAERIQSAVLAMMQAPPTKFPDLYGDGHSADHICKAILQYASTC